MPAIPAIIGIGGSLIGGLLGGNASRNAGRTIGAANTASAGGVLKAAGDATTGLQESTAQGQQGVSSATGQGQSGVATAQGQGAGNVAVAGGSAIDTVNSGVTGANTILGNNLAAQQNNLAPYQETGHVGAGALAQQVAHPFTAPTAAEAAASPGLQFQLQQGAQLLQQQAAAGGALQSGGTLKALTQYGQGVASTYYQNAFSNALSAFNTNTNTALAATNVGLQGSSMYNQATQNASNQQANNLNMGARYAGDTMQNTALFGANTGNDAARFNASLGNQGAEFNANLGNQGAITAGNWALQGATTAGNFYNQGAQGTAAGQQGQANAWSSGISGAINSVPLSWSSGSTAGNAVSGGFQNPYPPTAIPWYQENPVPYIPD